MNSYKVIVSLSHRRIAFQYWQRDGENRVVPMPGGTWPAPLAFLVSSSGIVIGDDAVRAANAGIENAFDGYFELLTDNVTYRLGTENRALPTLMLDGVESVLRVFFRDVLLNRLGSVTDNRASIPLILACESDVLPNERAFLLGLFRDSGYGCVKVVDYNSYIAQYVKQTLAPTLGCTHVLSVWTEGADLVYTLFDAVTDTEHQQLVLPGKGTDPRVEYAKQLVWDCFVAANPFLSRKDEEEYVEKAATDFLNSSAPLVNTQIMLSDGNNYFYSLDRNMLDFLPNNDGAVIKQQLIQFLAENGITDRSTTVLLLRGVAAGNSYFEQNLSHGFRQTVRTDSRLRNNTMRLLINEPHNATPIPATTPPPFVKPASTSAPAPAAEPAPKATPVPPVAPTQPAAPTQLTVDDKTIKALTRQWREARASAHGKASAGRTDEACKILSSFISSLKNIPGTDDLRTQAEAEIATFTPTKTSTEKAIKQPLPSVKANPQISPKSRPSSAPKVPKLDTLTQLLQSGQLMAARDLCRKDGDTERAKNLTDLIKAQRQVNPYINSLDSCRASKNKQQIERITTELEAYIILCRHCEAPVQPFDELLKNYQNIIKK